MTRLRRRRDQQSIARGVISVILLRPRSSLHSVEDGQPDFSSAGVINIVTLHYCNARHGWPTSSTVEGNIVEKEKCGAYSPDLMLYPGGA